MDMSSYVILLIILSILCISSNGYINKIHKFRYSSSIWIKQVDYEDQGLKEFLAGPENKKWGGVRDMLARKGQIPDEKYTPKDVVKVLLAALQDNDSPQLDHGACVVLEFRSTNGPLNDPNLDPSRYGQFLRSTEYSSLIDFKSAQFIGEPVEIKDSLSVKQSVNIIGWQSKGEENKIFDFYLSRIDNKWLVDVILLKK